MNGTEKHRAAIAALETALKLINSTIVELHMGGYNVSLATQPLHQDCNTVSAQMVDAASGLQFEIPVVTYLK